MRWDTTRLRDEYDVLAPDGSEIRVLVQVGGGSLVHCTVHPGQVTRAVEHRSVEEVWYCLSGSGELWRRQSDANVEETVALSPGVAVTIPLGTRFQFRALGDQPLEIVMTTMPPWPGADEAVPVDGHWTPSA